MRILSGLLVAVAIAAPAAKFSPSRAGLTDTLGNAEVPIPIPNDPRLLNASFPEQWLTVAGNAFPVGLEFSNTLQVTLQ